MAREDDISQIILKSFEGPQTENELFDCYCFVVSKEMFQMLSNPSERKFFKIHSADTLWFH